MKVEPFKHLFREQGTNLQQIVRLIILPLNLLLITLLFSCSKGDIGKVIVKDLVNPDNVPPTIEFLTDPTSSTLKGNYDFTLEYNVYDDPAGRGISSVNLFYTPDINTIPFKSLGSIPAGHNSVTFCVPNKTSSHPVFKIIAIDQNNNITEKALGDITGEQFNYELTTDNPTPIPTLSSLVGDVTKQATPSLAINNCQLNFCSTDALMYEPPTGNLYIMVKTDGANAAAAAAPAAEDSGWISCQEALENNITMDNFNTEGDYIYTLWTKYSDKEFDNTTPLGPFVSTNSSSKTIAYDITPPQPILGSTLVTFDDEFDTDGNDIAVHWSAFVELHPKSYILVTYTDQNCSSGEFYHVETGNPTLENSTVIDGLENGIYWAKVIAIDQVGLTATSECSDDFIYIDKDAPVAADNMSVSFVDTIDPDGNDISIQWTAFNDNTLLTDHRILTYTDSQCSQGEVDHGLTGSDNNQDASIIDGLDTGDYWAKVIAIDIAGHTTASPCSTNSIKVDVDSPYEADGGAQLQFYATETYNGDGLTKNQSDIAIQWQPFQDASGDISDHIIHIYSDASCSNQITVFNTGSSSNSDNGVVDLTSDGHYWGRVEAVDSLGHHSSLSACSSSTTTLSTNYYTSIIVDTGAPEDATHIPIFDEVAVATYDNIGVHWDAFIDPTLSDHQIFLYSDENCSNDETDKGRTGNSNNSTTFNVGADGDYYAKVIAYDGLGHQTTSNCSTSPIIVDKTPPEYGGSNTDANFTFNDDLINRGNNISVTWTPFTDAHLDHYVIYTYTDNACSENEQIHTEIDVSSDDTINSDTTSITGLNDDYNNGDHWAKIIAYDKSGNSKASTCSSDSIRIDLTPPTENSEGSNIQFTEDEVNYDSNIEVSWNAFSDLNGIADYAINTYTNSSCTSGKETHSKIGSNNTSDNTTVDELADGIYWATISAYDTAGNMKESACSTDSIIIDTTAPEDDTHLLEFDLIATNNPNSIGVHWPAFNDLTLDNHLIKLYATDGCKDTAKEFGPTNSTDANYTISNSGLDDGVYWGTVTAYDRLGHETTSDCSSDSIIIDTIAPTESDDGTNPQFTNTYNNTGDHVALTWTSFSDQHLTDYKIHIYSDNNCSNEVFSGNTGDTTSSNDSIITGLTDTNDSDNDGDADGKHYAKIEAIDIAGNTTLSACSTDYIIIDLTPPAENSGGTNFQFTNDYYNYDEKLNSSITPITWNAFTDLNGINDYQLTLYTTEDCSDESPFVFDKFGSNSTSQSIDLSGLADGKYYAKLTAFDNAGNSAESSCSTDFITVDTIPPDKDPIKVIGTVVTGQPYGFYMLNSCDDINKVMITRDTSSPPAADATEWQDCDAVNYSIQFNPLQEGLNELKFWLKDTAENVTTAFIAHQTFYNPPHITVVDGPTIATTTANMTIDYCDEADIKYVLFNETGTQPDSSDSAWQPCDTAIGALSYSSLTPGNHTLKAYFKYSDDTISFDPIDVPVRYEPPITWEEEPETNRPQLTFTISSCDGISDILFNQGSIPDAADGAWQTCSTTTGALAHTLTSDGNQTLNIWYKDSSGTVFSDYSQIAVNFVPPAASIETGANVSTSKPMLTINDCTNIDKVYVKLDDSTPTAPSSSDFDSSGQDCTTAMNAIETPDLGSEGVHTLDVWFRFNDGYILDPWYSRVTVSYTEPDNTPPPITSGEGADTPLTITLENGDSSSPPIINNYGSRAFYTLNTCTPNPPVALTGTVSVAANSQDVTGTSSAFSSELSAGDYINIAGEIKKISSITDDTHLTLVFAHTSGASNVSITKEYPNDTISKMIVTESSTAPDADNPDWLACSTTSEALKSKTLTPDGVHDLYIWFQDSAGNVSSSYLSDQVEIQTSADTTPPPRPEVIVEGAPTLTTAPAHLTITDCTDVDQIYIETSDYPDPYTAPDATASGWQECTEDTGAIIYNIALAGSYTVSVWFKDRAGNINDTPRDVSFIFDPAFGNLPTPIAYWTFDDVHFKNSTYLDIKGDHDLYLWDKSNIQSVTGKSEEAIQLTGTNSYLVTPNVPSLQPDAAITMSIWVYLTKGTTSTMGIAGAFEKAAGGYGFAIEDAGDGTADLKFYASGQDVSIKTTDYETGWHHLVGSSDGRYINLYLDGQKQTTRDLGAPANLTYGCNKIFAVGALTDCSNNPVTTNLFNDKIDEIVVWDKYLSDQDVLDHYIDTYNNHKVNQTDIKPADIASVSFYNEKLQNVFLTINDCGNNKFVYVNETTHPPTVDSPDWQICNTVKGGIIHPNLPQGPHELKVWGKDEYNNITNGYFKVDTVVSSYSYNPPGLLYYTFDNNQLDFNITQDLFSKHHATIVGADAGQSGIQNEALLFTRTDSDYVVRDYASNAQPIDKLTLSVWVELTQNDNSKQYIAGNLMNGHGYGFIIDDTNSELRFVVESSAGTRHVGISTASYESGFHNLIGTYDGQILTLYMDGTEIVSTDSGSSAPIQYTCLSSFTVGAGATCNNGPEAETHFNGRIDEVMLWDSVLSADTVYNFFNGEDTIPPLAVEVTPKDGEYTIEVPVAKLNVSNCDDIASVYVSLSSEPPPADIANWQACSTTGDLIKSPLLANGDNDLTVWFKDAAGNVSTTSMTLTMTFNQTSTIPSPLSYWTMDSVNIDGAEVFDITAGHNGTNYGADQTSGKIEQALYFDGVSDFIEVPYNADFKQTNEITLAAWFKVDAFDSNKEVIAGNFNLGGYELALVDNTIEFNVQTSDGIKTVSYSTSTLDTTQWHHVVGIYNSGTLRLFIDGHEETTLDSGTNTITYSTQNSFIIGAAPTASNGASANFFKGVIDDVAFWKNALTDTVVTDLYKRGQEGDLIYYDIDPPEIPVNMDILYYNSLVSRANLTVTDCTGLDYIIVTKHTFPPDKNDPDWQLCNTLIGGLLSKELNLNDSYGKLWTKDKFGNISKTFEYVPLVTKYDKPIARPVVHWTFDNAHYDSATRVAYDRISQINLQNDALKEVSSDTRDPGTPNLDPPFDDCTTHQELDQTYGAVVQGGEGVLNEGLEFAPGKWLYTRSPENMKLKPSSTLSIAVWVYLKSGSDVTYPIHDQHIISTDYSTDDTTPKGWALRVDAINHDDRGLRFTVHTAGGTLEPYLETKNYTTGWHLVIGTYDGQTAALYFDGIFVKSFSNPTPQPIIYEDNVSLMVGAKASTDILPTEYTHEYHKLIYTAYGVSCELIHPDNTYFQGKIDEIVVWDQVLTKLEASSLYHNGADIIYQDDHEPPTTQPTLQLENTRPNIFANKAYFTLTGSGCTDISGVLVNEGTMPDKQDERWEVCRTRRGSFGIENLTPGGHTITVWFKDLAGNVTPVSSDLVVYYDEANVPYANAYWPLDANATVANYARDVVENNVHDLLLTNINTPLNPGATHFSAKVNEGINLIGSQSHLSTMITTLLSPVNFLSVGGWFELTQGDWTTRVLIDEHHYDADTNRGGFKLWTEGGNLNFKLELDIAKAKTISVPTDSYSTGWHHILGVWTGLEMYLYIDGNKVASLGPLPERDFLRYDRNDVFFRVGAEAKHLANPINYLNSGVDELGVWGIDLTPTQVIDAFNKGNNGEHISDPLPAPNDVDNAYIYPFDIFGSRARMTILDCTNTPWIYVTAEGSPVPSSDDPDWQECRTIPGAILSTTLPVDTTYVQVYAKNSDGVISTIPGRKEITPITADYYLELPIIYHDFNNNHIENSTIYDFMSHINSTMYGQPHITPNDEGDELVLDTSDGTTDYIDIPSSPNFDLRHGITIALWADITNGDTSYKRIVSRYADPNDTAILLSGGYLRFRVNINQPTGYNRATSYPEAIFPTSKITTGKHFIVATYNGIDLKLYIDSALVATQNVGERSWADQTVNRLIETDQVDGFRIGYKPDDDDDDDPPTPLTGRIDEFMVFNRVLDGEQITHHYQRYLDALNRTVRDSTPPTTTPNLSVLASTYSGSDWPTDNDTPMYSISNCTDISGVYITIDNQATPLNTDAGWQLCSTEPGSLIGPTLSEGTHTIHFWFRDQYGNITSSSQDISVTYNIPPTPSPVAYWSFDDNTLIGRSFFEAVNQIDAYNYEGDIIPGPVGTAVQFDHKRKYIEVEHDLRIKPEEELTIAFWAYIPIDVDNRINTYIFSNRGDSPEGILMRWACDFPTPPCPSSHEYLETIVNINNRDINLIMPQELIGTGWKHFVITFDNRRLKLYENNSLIKEIDLRDEQFITYNPASNTSLIIGADASDQEKPSGGYFQGAIDELAIWNTALYPAQIADIFNNFSNNNTRIYNPIRNLITPPSDKITIHNPNEKPLGSRLRLTISDCTGMDMVLVNNSTDPPAATDENWQPCNTYEGGILSAPFPAGDVTPKVWAKTFDGVVSNSYGTANDATITMPTFGSDIPRPIAFWSLDSASTGTYVDPQIFDSLYRSHGELDADHPPVSTATSGADAVIEEGFSFNGVDQFIKIHPTSETNPMYQLSISAWVELEKGETAYRHIVGNIQNMEDETGAGSGLRIKDGQLQFYVTAWTGSDTQTYTVGLDTNIYSSGLHHVVGTYDGRDLNLYLDGVFVKSYFIQFYGSERYELYHDDHSYWTIGAESSTDQTAAANSFFRGVIDDIMIWRVPLTEQQIYYLYEYGADFIPTNVSDGIPPTDPGIELTDNLTTTSSPWSFFTMPSCIGANGVEVNAIYINASTDPAPNADDIGWQYCTQDEGYVISQLLQRGENTINVYFRDEEGDISTATSFNVTYIPPELFNPLAYYSFNSGDVASNTFYYDLAGTKNISAVDEGDTRLIDAKVDKGILTTYWKSDSANNTYFHSSAVDHTYTFDYAIKKDFSVTFWYQPTVIDPFASTLLNQGQFSIYKTGSDNIAVAIQGNNTAYSRQRMRAHQWTHIGVVRRNGVLKIFINGRLDSTTSIWDNNLPYAASRLSFANTAGIYDELAIYDQALTDEQIAYIYFKGERNETIDTFPKNIIPAKIPNYYWNFDSSSFSDPNVNAITGDIDFKRVYNVTTGNSDAKVGESFYFNNLQNSDPPQYLETTSISPIKLGSDFTISTWVRQDATDSTNDGYPIDPYGRYTTIIDQWGTSEEEQSFQLIYDRRYGNFIFRARIGSGDQESGIETLSTDLVDLISNSNWQHITIRRHGISYTFYLNGKEAGSLSTGSYHNYYDTAKITPLTVGNSTFAGRYTIRNSSGDAILGTIDAGSTLLTSSGNHFKSLYFDHIKGNVTVAAESDQLIGTETSFTTDLQVGDHILLGTEVHTIKSIEDDTHLTLEATHATGVSNTLIIPLLAGTVSISSGSQDVVGTDTSFTTDLVVGSVVAIGDEIFSVSSIKDDTNLRVSRVALVDHQDATYHLNTLRILQIGSEVHYPIRILSDDNLVFSTPHTTGADELTMFYIPDTYSDDYQLHGALDEMAIWDSALTQSQIYQIYQRGLNGYPIYTTPQLRFEGSGSTTNELTIPLTLSDCADYAYVWIGLNTDADPDANDSGWVSCTTAAGALLSPTLNADTINTIKIWFKKPDGTVASYTTTTTITHSSGDTTPPVIPNITQETSSPTEQSFARYTLDTCNDIAGVFINTTGITPSKDTIGWKNCSTITAAMLSPVLQEGSNTVSFWFKDEAGNITARTDMSIEHTLPSIPTPSIYFTMDNQQKENNFIRETIHGYIASAPDMSNIETGIAGNIAEAINFFSNAFYELWGNPLNITNDLSISVWLNISAPTTNATIVNRWDETIANNKYAFRIDNTGRICLDFQTTNSDGTWNTDSYKRVCSLSKIAFNEWGHIGIIKSGGDIHFYYNNKDVGSETVDSNNLISTDIPFRLGGQNRGGVEEAVNGSIDELAIWTTALSTTQLEAIYARGLRLEPIATEIQPQVAAIPDNYWDFESNNYSSPTLSAVLGGIDLTDQPSTSDPSTSVIPDNSGQISKSFSFAGENLMSSSSNSIDLGTSFTISTWISLNSESGIILNKWNPDDTSKQEFKLYVSNKYIKFAYTTTSSSGEISSQTQLELNTWTHILITRNNDDLRIYINGNLEALQSISTDPLTNIDIPLLVGGEEQSESATNFFNGTIDETVIWKRNLEDRQIKYIYQHGTLNQPTPVSTLASVALASNTTKLDTVPISISDCQNYTDVLIQLAGSGTPSSTDSNWQTCSEDIGAIVSPNLTTGTNTYEVWFKTNSSVESNYTTTLDITKE